MPAGLAFLRRLAFPRKLGFLEKVYGRSLRRLGVAWIQCSNGVVWKLDLTDPTQRWIVYGDYQGPPAMAWARHWLKDGGVVVDSGANIGQMLLYFAPLRGVRVLAFEPLPHAHNWLSECAGLYPHWNVDIIKAGLGDAHRNEWMQCDGPRSTTNLGWYRSRDLPRINIEIDRLDRYRKKFDLQRIRLWKLDVEGAEYEALKGAERLFADGSIEAMLLECNPKNFERVRDYLYGHNCRMYIATGRGLVAADASDASKKDFIVLREP